jgi:hypothetical protein
MVNVERQATAAGVRDEAALDIFRHQWELYRKFLRHDYLENAGAYAELHRFLTENVTRAFAFVDLACGDAIGIVTALEGTVIAHYRGIDLAPPALELARHNLEALQCVVELDEADFVQAMRSGSEPADVVWISLSLHHLTTPDKRALMREVPRPPFRQRRVPHLRADVSRRRGPRRLPRPLRGDGPAQLDRTDYCRVPGGDAARANLRPARDRLAMGDARARGGLLARRRALQGAQRSFPNVQLPGVDGLDFAG